MANVIIAENVDKPLVIEFEECRLEDCSWKPQIMFLGISFLPMICAAYEYAIPRPTHVFVMIGLVEAIEEFLFAFHLRAEMVRDVRYFCLLIPSSSSAAKK